MKVWLRDVMTNISLFKLLPEPVHLENKGVDGQPILFTSSAARMPATRLILPSQKDCSKLNWETNCLRRKVHNMDTLGSPIAKFPYDRSAREQRDTVNGTWKAIKVLFQSLTFSFLCISDYSTFFSSSAALLDHSSQVSMLQFLPQNGEKSACH